MTSIVLGIVALALINFAFKAAGPALLVDLEPSPSVSDLITAMSPALLAGLVTVELAGPRWHELDVTVLPGLVAAGLASCRGLPDLACVAIAVLVAAGLRLV